MARVNSLILILLLCLASQTSAAIIPMEVVAPCTLDDSSRCENLSPLTDLRSIVIKGQRCGEVDTVTLGEIPAIGRECDTLRFDIQIDSTGTTYDLWAVAKRMGGKESICASHFSLAVPKEQYSAGLWAEYFADTSFVDFRKSKTEPNIDFNWGTGSPDPSMPVDRWSGRYMGKIRTIGTGTYNFRAYINNGFRMWIGSTPIMIGDSWSNPNTHYSTGSIDLAGGTEYDFTAEYRDECCEAFIHLYWTPPGLSEQIIPASAFTH